MRILLDTHVLLWWLMESPKLSPRLNAALADPRHDVLVSSVTHAEIAIKRSLEKLEAPSIPDALLEENGIGSLPFTSDHGRRLLELPFHHRDPFDRMLIAQAVCDDLVVATDDPLFRRYDIRVLPDA